MRSSRVTSRLTGAPPRGSPDPSGLAWSTPAATASLTVALPVGRRWSTGWADAPGGHGLAPGGAPGRQELVARLADDLGDRPPDQPPGGRVGVQHPPVGVE